MTDDEKASAHRAITLAQRAKAILDDPIVVEGRQMVRDSIMAQWIASPARDSEGRERLYLMLHLHDRVWAHLEGVFADGKVADSTLPAAERRGLIKF